MKSESSESVSESVVSSLNRILCNRTVWVRRSGYTQYSVNMTERKKVSKAQEWDILRKGVCRCRIEKLCFEYLKPLSVLLQLGKIVEASFI